MITNNIINQALLYILQGREFCKKMYFKWQNYVDFNNGVWYNSYCKCKLCYPITNVNWIKYS